MQKYDKEQVQQNFSRKVESYNANARLQKRVVIELLNRAGKLEGDVLDIGAGTGLIAENASFAPIEMDLSLEMCKASAGLSVNADAEALPFADGSFDHIVSSLTIQWLNSLDALAEEMMRVLRPKGSFFISTFGNGTLRELGTTFGKLDDSEHLIRFPNTILLFAVLKKAGFEKLDIHTQTITYHHENVMEILQQMKNIGATYGVAGSRKKGLAGKNYFKKLDGIYRDEFTNAEGKLPVTWQALYITGSKP